MKMFIPILFMASVALAEPPVGDGYAAARSSHEDHYHDHHHGTSHQRSPSQEYGPPSDTVESTRNAPSDGYDYNAPNARNALTTRGQSRFPPATVRVSFNQRFSSAAARNSNNAAGRSHAQEHSAPNTRSGISQQYGAPASSSLSQEYSAPASRSLSQEYSSPASRSLSQEYGAPASRSLSQEYGAPASRSLSQEYGVPSVVSARTLSTEYGMPDARSTSSQEYGVPVVAARSNQKLQSSNFRSSQPPKALSHDHSSPASRSQFQTDSVSEIRPVPSARSNNIYVDYEAPQTSFGARTAPSTTYDAPSRSSASHGISSARNSDSQIVDSISATYGAPNQRSLDETYGAPSARDQPQEHGALSSRANLMTSAIPSLFPSPSSRSSPSSSYLPASRNAAPSEEYGVPEQRDSAGQGYDYTDRARALEELQNQEPASYDFGYQIEDQESGSDFGHTETREAGKAHGSYFVVRPDGTKQTVEYEADERGFKPRISVEPAGAARAAGYDENAQDATSSDQGPY